MNPGDLLRVHMHDTSAGYRVGHHRPDHAPARLDDGQHRQRLRAHPVPAQRQDVPRGARTRSTRCTTRPCSRGTTWAAHTTNVGFVRRDRALRVLRRDRSPPASARTPAGPTPRSTSTTRLCLDGAQFGALIPIKGCVLDDGDFDGPSYQRDWPGTSPNPARTGGCTARPSSSRCRARTVAPLERRSFETDLPRIERGEPGNPTTRVRRATGANCVNPPPGAEFYPIYTLDQADGQVLVPAGRDATSRHRRHASAARRRRSTAPRSCS